VKKSGACPKCKSTKVIADARVRDRGDFANMAHELQISTYRNPDAMIFKEARLSTVSAWVCGDCGFVELYADSPRTLIL
jgi:predicted nucleic-acid-binding Zn-ribbon protein